MGARGTQGGSAVEVGVALPLRLARLVCASAVRRFCYARLDSLGQATSKCWG